MGNLVMKRRSNSCRWLRFLLLALLPVLSSGGGPLPVPGPGTGVGPGVESRVEPQADVLLRRMGAFLGQQPFFSVNAEIWQDSNLWSGQRVQSGRNVMIQIRRPNRFRAEMRSTRRSRGLIYDGKSLTLVDRVGNYFGTIPAPALMDEALDVAVRQFGISLPLEDFIVLDPYQSAMRQVTSGVYIGPVTVLGVPCEHLAFSQGSIDWQVWIQEGPVPVPRKVVITYKDEVGAPQYTAILSGWDFSNLPPDVLFVFEPTQGITKIPVAEIRSQSRSLESNSIPNKP